MRKFGKDFAMFRGKTHVEVFGDDFPGENPEGAALFGEKLPGIIAMRAQRSSKQKPRVVFSDRGKGFYAPNGYITHKWSAALTEGPH